MDTIGERIRFIRKKNGLKQEEFAKDLSVSRSFISRIESNKEKASDTVLKLMSLQYNVSLRWLTNGKGEYEADKDYDYFGRGYEEKFKSGLIPSFNELLDELDNISSASLYLAVDAIISDYTNLLRLYRNSKNIGIVIFDALNNNIISLINAIYMCEEKISRKEIDKTEFMLNQTKEDLNELIEELQRSFKTRLEIDE